jgi:uncharacterized membrane protein
MIDVSSERNGYVSAVGAPENRKVAAHRDSRPASRPGAQRGRSMLVTFAIGVGIMAAVDEIVFHQILAWHHFYDQSTPQIGLLSDGLLHTAEIVIIVAGFFAFADLRRRHALTPVSAWGGFFLGLGAFQLFDGLVDHKLLRLHQVRYGVENPFAYDLAWIIAGAVLLLIGAALAWRCRTEGTPSPATHNR